MTKLCKNKDTENPVELHCWTEKDAKLDCDLPCKICIYLMVEVKNYKRKEVEFDLEAISVNSIIEFAGGGHVWRMNAQKVSGKRDPKHPNTYPCNKKMSRVAIINTCKTESIKTKITYWNANSSVKVPTDVSTEITLELK